MMPRDMEDWIRYVERKIAENQRSIKIAITQSGGTGGNPGEPLPPGKQPAAPVELTVQTAIYLDMNGQWRGRVMIDFPDVTKATDATDIEIMFYELQGYQTTVLPPVPAGEVPPPPQFTQMMTSPISGFRIDDLDPATSWKFRIRAYAVGSITPGVFSAELSVTIMDDIVPPPQPTAPVATVSRGTITVTWDGLAVTGDMPSDFAYAELAMGPDSSPTEIVAYFNNRGGFHVFGDIPYYDVYFFRLRAVDMSGNVGPWSEADLAFTEPLVDTDIILSTIDAAETQLINVDAGVSILSNTILTRHLVVTEEMTVALLAAHKIIAGDIAANAIEADKIKAGAVTAVKLEAVLILGTTIIAGNHLGDHAEMSPDGFHVYAEDLVTGVPREVIRLGVAATHDYFAVIRADNTLAASISEDGVVSALQGNFTNALWYKGRELSAVLNELPKGIIAAAARYTWSGVNSNPTNGNIPFLRLEVILQPGRIYKISTSGLPTSRSASGVSLTTGILFNELAICTLENGVHLTNGTVWDEGNAPVHQELFALQGTTARTVSFLVWMGALGGDGGFRPALNNPARLMVEDLGLNRNSISNGSWLDGTPGGGNGTQITQPKNTFVKQYGCTASMNYQGNNAQYNYDLTHMYQGLSPAGYGNLKSIALFDWNAIVADTAGAVINYVRVGFYFIHWYYNAGGTANIGVHGHTGLPGSFSSVGPLTIISTGWPKPGLRWIDLSPGHWDDFRNGVWKGVYLSGDGTYNTYGFADRPTLEISYTK